jgi:hypothetical protein
MGTPRGIAIMLSVSAVAVAVAAGLGATAGEPGAQAASAAPSTLYRTAAVPADAPLWLAGLIARSDALNRLYELGEYAPRAKPVDEDLPGVKERGEAMNRLYGLGR